MKKISDLLGVIEDCIVGKKDINKEDLQVVYAYLNEYREIKEGPIPVETVRMIEAYKEGFKSALDSLSHAYETTVKHMKVKASGQN